jgi:hypothetical protein
VLAVYCNTMIPWYTYSEYTCTNKYNIISNIRTYQGTMVGRTYTCVYVYDQGGTVMLQPVACSICMYRTYPTLRHRPQDGADLRGAATSRPASTAGNTWILDVGVVCPGTRRYVDQGSSTTRRDWWRRPRGAFKAAKYAHEDIFITFILETGGRVNKAARDWLDALTAPEPGEQVPSQGDHPLNPQTRTTTETVLREAMQALLVRMIACRPTCFRGMWWRFALQTSLLSWNRSPMIL